MIIRRKENGFWKNALEALEEEEAGQEKEKETKKKSKKKTDKMIRATAEQEK